MSTGIRILSVSRAAAAVVALCAVAGPVRALPHVVQVIDGLPQVIVPQQIVLRCGDGLAADVCSRVLNLVGATVVATGLAGHQLAVLPAGIPLQGALDLLHAAGVFASAEPNRVFIGSSAYAQTWEFPAAGAPGDSPLMPASQGAPIVAVIDSGVAYESYRDALGSYLQAPVFSQTRFAPGWDFVNNDAHPNDDNGHGTAMASIIVGRGSFSTAAVPFVGAANGATLMPIKVLDATNQGTEFWLAEGIRYAVRGGARVINLSLDFARNYVVGASLGGAIAEARAAGVVIVAASGNTGDGRVLFPASFPDVLSVGALRLDAAAGYAVASYSNSGEALDLVAPGGAMGQDVNKDGLWDGDLAQSFPPGSPSQISWWLFAGTSPATAHASAAAAALLGAGADPHAVRPLLLASAANLGAGGWDAASGAGRLQTSTAVAAVRSYVAPAPLYADVVAALRQDGRAAGAVMIANASGAPVPNVEVHARWRGAASASQVAVTDSSGIARFVSPAASGSHKLFLLEVPRVISAGAPQRPLAFARGAGGFNSLVVSLSLGTVVSSLATSLAAPLDSMDIWGTGGSGLGSGTTGSGLGSGTTGSGDGASLAGSGLGSGTTGSGGGGATGSGGGSATGIGAGGLTAFLSGAVTNVSAASSSLTLNIAACPTALQLFSYNQLSTTAAQAFFSGSQLASGYSVRSVDSSWVLSPGAAALDAQELGVICGLSVAYGKPLATNYFSSGTLYLAGVGTQPAGYGAGDVGRFWSEVLNLEGNAAP